MKDSPFALEPRSRFVLRPIVLLLADISGYTRFLRLPDVSLVHAQSLVDLLMSAITNARGLPVSVCKIVGDSALYYLHPDGLTARRAVIEAAEALLREFAREQARIETLRICECSACRGVRNLRLKFFAHAGQAVMTIRDEGIDFSGPDVVLLHLLQKTPLPWREYLLMTPPVAEALPPAERDRVQRLRRTVPGFGSVDLVARPLSRPSPPVRLHQPRGQGAEHLRHGLHLDIEARRHRRLADHARYANLPAPAPPATAGAGGEPVLAAVGNLSGPELIR